MDTITKDRLRSEWSDWLQEQQIDFDTEWLKATRETRGGIIDVERVRCTAFLRGDTGYKMLRRHLPGIRQMPHAWEFIIDASTMPREALHRAVRTLEASPLGLEHLFQQKLPLIGSERRRFGLIADPCDEWLGPPPADATYFEIDWTFRRSTAAWAQQQAAAHVMGPERVRRCLMGMRAVHIVDADEVVTSLGISHSRLQQWLEAGTELIPDEFVLMDAHRRALPQTEFANRIRPILELASYERFSPPAGYWTVSEGLGYIKGVRTGAS